MKKLCVLLFTLFFLINISFAQNGVKRYVLLEHYTNTDCPLCATRNPAFFNLISNYEEDVHHIAYHPSTPSTDCVFYSQNKTGNQIRADYYDIQSTPDVIMLGEQPSGGGLLNQNALEAEIGKKSPLEIVVTEEGNVFRTVYVSVNTFDTLPPGNYRLYLMAVEKNIDYNAPNGETMHRNVFRKSIPADGGVELNPAPIGESVNFSFGFPIDFDWFEDQIYITAFVQNADTKEVINSGTKFDDRTSTSLNKKVNASPLYLNPNPVEDNLYIKFGENTIHKPATLKIYDIQGSLLREQYLRMETDQIQVSVVDLPSGVLVIQIENKEGLWVGRVVK